MGGQTGRQRYAAPNVPPARCRQFGLRWSMDSPALALAAACQPVPAWPAGTDGLLLAGILGCAGAAHCIHNCYSSGSHPLRSQAKVCRAWGVRQVYAGRALLTAAVVRLKRPPRGGRVRQTFWLAVAIRDPKL